MASERDAKGRFANGNKAANGNNGGRPTKQREERYREILKEAITFEDFRSIVKRLGEKAKRGDVQAAKLLLEYLVGKPEQNVNLAGSIGVHDDLAEWKRKSQAQLDAVAEMEEPECAT